MKTRLLVVDTETGGLRADRHALLSIAAVDSESGEAFHALIRPSADWIVEKEALDINGLSLSFLREHGRPETVVINEFAAWMRSRPRGVFGGVCPSFDIDFLQTAARRNGVDWLAGRSLDLRGAAWLAYERGEIDLPLSKTGHPRLSLDSIAGSLGLSRSGETHDALEDALLTMACFKTLCFK
jgi:DNA polymerase III subunit epsilon